MIGPVPVGTRVRLVSMPNDPDPIAVGDVGTVVGGHIGSIGDQVWVRWDSGRTLNLLPKKDTWEVIGVEVECEWCMTKFTQSAATHSGSTSGSSPIIQNGFCCKSCERRFWNHDRAINDDLDEAFAVAAEREEDSDG